MVQRGGDQDDCRLRIDPVLVDKFRRLPAGINEVGTKIVRDLGLRYQYDKNRGTLEIVGPDTEILALAAETLRFWVEEDEFPDTGITCQVGYPNRCIVIWRFHGDYAKKFDHLFADDIAKLKLITSVNIKAVPTKLNPEYIELFCHFSVYQKVKSEVVRISKELGKIFQDDFFIPDSDFLKARNFARSKISDSKVLYALKEYPDNKVRVWLFARDHMDVVRAKKEWVIHVGIIARDNEFRETVRRDNSVKSASFFGHPASELGSEMSGPTQSNKEATKHGEQEEHMSKAKQITQTSFNLSQSRVSLKSETISANKDFSARAPRVDNSNFPRPSDFVYPIQKEPQEGRVNDADSQKEGPTNPFEANAEMLEEFAENGVTDTSHPTLGDAKWVQEDESTLYRAKNISQSLQKRIYLHHQINEQQLQNQQPPQSKQTDNYTDIKQTGKQVVHPEKNLIEKERFNPTHHSKSVLTSVTDPRQAPAIKRGNKGLRPGEKATRKPVKVKADTRQKRPVLKSQKQPNIRYNINVNGLDIYMYKQDITKLNNMDALVNVVAPSLKEGDRISQTLLAEAGKKVTDELDVHLSLHGESKMAENVVTSAGRLPVLGLIHVVSPIWQMYTVWQDCASDLHKALYDTLKTAEAHKYRKIGIPTIGSEPYFGIPKDLVAEVYVKALVDYSMGMGPMYPVLEIHLVDTDHNMLTYIKDAYESWASTPGVADMTHHITKESENIIKDPHEVSTRAQSAVSLKTIPSHISENMVTFTGQSYTKEGEQKWTFDVLKKLAVHVYTGSILKVDGVEAIVCAVDANMKGTLARQVQSLGGKSYKTSLKSARGNRTLVEGEVLVCAAGELGMRKILHSVISAPIRQINQRNLSRLDSINGQVFHAANQNGIKVLAMPLIGTGSLRERVEVEQCSLQLIDDIIELCLSLGKGMKIKELHLVNTNHAMTQSLTQALRTRAHTKLRVETEPHLPSRQDLLTKTEAIRGTAEKIDKMSARSVRSKGSSSKSTSSFTNKNRSESRKQSKNNDTYDKSDQDVNKGLENKETVSSTIRENKIENIDLDKRKTQPNETFHNKAGNNKQMEKKTKSTEHMPYLSQQNLETHDRLIRDTWVHLMDVDMEIIADKTAKDRKKPQAPKRHNELEPLDKGTLIKRAHEFINERKIEKTKKPRKKRQRIIQRSSDYVLQTSKAKSYRSLFEKKQKYAEQVHREEQLNLRKTQSSDDIWKKQLADKVFETFKEEREKLSRQRGLALKANEDLTKEENTETDTFLHETKKYFTRDTKDRYKQKADANADDVNDKFENITRISVNEGDSEKRDKKNEKQNMTSRSEEKRPFPKSKKIRSERHMIDTEREDQYMMDMDFFTKEIEEWEGQKKAKEIEEWESQKKEKEEAMDTDADELLDKSYTKSERSRNMRKNRFIAMTSSEKKVKELDKHTTSAQQNQPRHQRIPANNRRRLETLISKGVNDSEITPGNEIGFEKELSANSLKETDIHVPTSKDGNAYDRFTSKVDEILVNSRNENSQSKSQALKSGKSFKTYTVTASKEGERPLYDNSHFNNERENRQGTGRVQFIQNYNSKPKSEHEIPKLTKTVEWKNERIVTKEALKLFNDQRRMTKHTLRPDEVTIRDKLKLHINVVDTKTEDSDQIEGEKKKIRRFWEAVDGKEIRNEKEMFGETESKDKMIVTKVTKERKMSAKTKVSKKSQGSVVTHNVGNYNITLEMEN